MKVKIPDSRILATIDEIRNPVVPLGLDSVCVGTLARSRKYKYGQTFKSGLDACTTAVAVHCTSD